jgi:hypothetical protein
VRIAAPGETVERDLSGMQRLTVPLERVPVLRLRDVAVVIDVVHDGIEPHQVVNESTEGPAPEMVTTLRDRRSLDVFAMERAEEVALDVVKLESHAERHADDWPIRAFTLRAGACWCPPPARRLHGSVKIPRAVPALYQSGFRASRVALMSFWVARRGLSWVSSSPDLACVSVFWWLSAHRRWHRTGL